MDRKRIALASAAALMALALWLAWLWQPERQVRLHTAHLLKAVERRNWDKVGNLLAESYTDRWGHDKEFVLPALREVFQQFLFLKIQHEIDPIILDAGTGQATARIKMSGNGGPIAIFVMEKVNALPEPFTFTWVQRSGKPWDWELTRVDHPSLEPGAAAQF